MNKDLKLMVELLSNHKRVDPEIVFRAVESGLAFATQKSEGKDIRVKVHIDRDSGDYRTERVWEILADDAEIESPEHQLTLAQAIERDSKAEVGGEITEQHPSIPFKRIGAKAAEQLIYQEIRKEERNIQVREYQELVGTIMTMTVKRSLRDKVLLEINSAEAVMFAEHKLPKEVFRPGDRVRVYLYEVSHQLRGPQLFVSRSHPQMLVELFRIEVPEIGEDVIQIKAAARDPGIRAKIAVKTNDGRIDPIGACVGMRGARVQAVSGELGGERVDIILWDDNPAQLVINALAPAEVASVVVDEENHTMDIAVNNEFLSQAIGRNGQNIRLASQLTGWVLNVMSEEDFATKTQQESADITALFTEQLEVDDEVAQVLIDAGFNRLDDIAYAAESELAAIEDFDEEIAQELKQRANKVLLTKALTQQNSSPSDEPSHDLLAIDGMDEMLAKLLASNGIITRDDLAEMSVDELCDISETLSTERAGALIMKAREHWFTADEDGIVKAE